MNAQEQHENDKRTAFALLRRHDHSATNDPEVRENCGACVLNGYHQKGERRDFINYAGWARVYIQAGKRIDKKIQFAFLAELASENRAYADALKDDIRQFGINCEAGSFKNAVREVLGIYD